MAIFTAYFDRGGSENTEALCVAGYVADVDQWIRFENEWYRVLADYNVKIFHMKEFTAGRGDFASWRDDQAARKRFLERLVGITRIRVRKSFSVAVLMREYRDVDQRYELSEYVGSPFALCGWRAIYLASKWARTKLREDDRLGFVFEQEPKGKGKLIDLLEKKKFPIRLSFGTKELAPLQAADFVAWEHQKACTRLVTSPKQEIRRSLLALDEIPNEWGIYRTKNLEGFCNRAGIARRSRT